MAPRYATTGADDGRGSVDETSISLPCSTAMDHDLPLVERTLAGELSAYEVLVERHRDAVFRVAARIVGRDEAEDVTRTRSSAPFTGSHASAARLPFATGCCGSPTTPL